MARHAGSAAGAVSTAAAAQDQKDPDNFAAPASTAAVVMFETAANAASTAAAENQDEPNEIEASSRPASASTVTTAVCCRYITHVRSSIKRLITLYHMTPGLHMFPVNCKNKGKFYGTCMENMIQWAIIIDGPPVPHQPGRRMPSFTQDRRKKRGRKDGSESAVLSVPLCETLYVHGDGLPRVKKRHLACPA